MRIFNFARVRSGSPAVELLQDALVRFFRSLEVNPSLDGRSLTVTVVAGTPIRVLHGLGRTPVGWHLEDIRVASTVFRTAWDNDSITFDASVNCTVSIWVF